VTKLDTGNIDMMIEKVCRIPVEFKSAGTRSVNDLVKESGYLENTAFLTVESVESCLRKHPGLANAWLQYSEDKRTDAGWYESEKVLNTRWVVCKQENVLSLLTTFVLRPSS